MLERPEVKGPVLRSIESAARPEAVIGSNTSTLPIGDLAADLEHPERFLGIHFSNPAPFIPGVELIAHSGTDEDVIEAVEALVPVTGKLTARVQRQGRLCAQPAAVRAAQGSDQPRRGGRGHARGRGHHRPHHLRLPAALLWALCHRRHGRPGRLPRRLPHPATALRRAVGGAQDAHRTRLGRAVTGSSKAAASSPQLATRHRWSPTATPPMPG